MSPSTQSSNVQLLTISPWTKKMKKRIDNLSIKEVRSFINAGLITTQKNKKSYECVAFTTETAAMKLIVYCRKQLKSGLSKPVSEKQEAIKTNTALPKNMLIEGQMVAVGKSFCPAIDIGVTTFTKYIKDGLFRNANIRIEKIGNGTERARYMIEWMGMKKAMQIKKICYSHKPLAEKKELMEVLLEPDDLGLEDEPEALEEEINVSEEVVEASEDLSAPVASSTLKIKDAFLDLIVALLEPIVLRMKRKGILR